MLRTMLILKCMDVCGREIPASIEDIFDEV
jgi:hypothetical protein